MSEENTDIAEVESADAAVETDTEEREGGLKVGESPVRRYHVGEQVDLWCKVPVGEGQTRIYHAVVDKKERAATVYINGGVFASVACPCAHVLEHIAVAAMQQHNKKLIHQYKSAAARAAKITALEAQLNDLRAAQAAADARAEGGEA